MFIETIKVENKTLINLDLHQARLSKTIKEKLHEPCTIQLASSIIVPKTLKNFLYKCRVVYDTKIISIEFIAYTLPKINTLQVVHTNAFDYNYKYQNRQSLSVLYSQKKNQDDIIIVIDDIIKDSYYGNLVFNDGNQLFTPKHALLEGTQRERLLNKKIIQEKNILIKDITKYQSVQIINAMLDLNDGPVIPIEKVFV